MKEFSTALTIFQSCLREFPKQPCNPSNNIVLQSLTDLSDVFNEHFSTIASKLATEWDSTCSRRQHFSWISQNLWQKVSFHPDKCQSSVEFRINLVNLRQLLLDKISARLIRENTDLICIPISKIFNSSLTSGVFPNEGECAKVTPLLNQGSSNDMNNYRPRQILYLWGD